MRNQGTVYLLHFSEAYKPARHYVGFTTNLDERLETHSRGAGARLLEVIAGAGIRFRLVGSWQGSRKTERRIKNRKESPALCPICDPQAMKRAKAIN